jgi:hypothetical protein
LIFFFFESFVVVVVKREEHVHAVSTYIYVHDDSSSKENIHDWRMSKAYTNEKK